MSEDKKDQRKRVPPVGLIPRHIFVENRIIEITSAIVRYAQHGKSVPSIWIKELQIRLSERVEIEDEKSNETKEDDIEE